jgi:hypothetical protein
MNGWREGNHPKIISEDDPKIDVIPILAGKVRDWMEDAKRIAIGSYRQVSRTARRFLQRVTMKRMTKPIQVKWDKSKRVVIGLPKNK